MFIYWDVHIYHWYNLPRNTSFFSVTQVLLGLSHIPVAGITTKIFFFSIFANVPVHFTTTYKWQNLPIVLPTVLIRMRSHHLQVIIYTPKWDYSYIIPSDKNPISKAHDVCTNVNYDKYSAYLPVILYRQTTSYIVKICQIKIMYFFIWKQTWQYDTNVINLMIRTTPRWLYWFWQLYTFGFSL